MIARHKIIYGVLVIYCVIATAFVAHQSGSLQLAIMIAVVALFWAAIASVVALVRDWKNLRLWAAAPLAGCVMAFVVPFYAGDLGREFLFTRNLARYESMVRRADAELRPDKQRTLSITLTDTDREFTYFVLAERDARGNLLVEIATEGGFPVKHSGYVYCETGTIGETEIGKRWPYQRQVRSKWFRVIN